MVSPSDDSSQDPPAGSLVDPAVLAERRARRAGASEDGLLERTQRAEQMVVTLEHRLGAAEERLASAQRERGAIATDLQRAEGELAAAQEREAAEQQLRAEVEGSAGVAVRTLEAETEHLRGAQRAAEARADELARALRAAQAEVEAARERAELERRAAAQDEAEELARLRGLADDLHGVLLGERSAREEVERTLEAERERTAAELVALEEELARRAAAQDAVGSRIAELRDALGAVPAHSTDAARELSAAGAREEQLRHGLAILENQRAHDAAELAQARAAVHAREEELRAAEEELLARARALRELRDAAEAHRVAAEGAQAEAAELRVQVVALRAEIEAERGHRAAVGAEVARAVSHQAEADAAHEAATARAQELQRTLDDLREEWGRATAELEGRVAEERAAREVAEAELAAEREARAVLEARLDGQADLGEDVNGAIVFLHAELEAAHRRQAEQAARDAAVAELVAELVAQADGLQEGVQAQLDAARAELAEAVAAREAAEAQRERAEAEREAAEERAAAVTAELTAELERLRAGGAPPSIYDAVPSGPLLPAPDHPALRRPEGLAPGAGEEPPGVVADLARAAERLRAAAGEPEGGEERAGGAPEAAGEEPEPEPAAVAEPVEEPTLQGSPPQAAEPPAPAPPSPEPEPEVVLPAALTGPAEARPWLGRALVALAGADAAAAERVLLAALPVQADRVTRDVAYVLDLPVGGRHHVRVRRGTEVAVAPLRQGERPKRDLTLTGPAAALAPLVAGEAGRRLPGVGVRGRRARLRRLLRGLEAPVGLAELGRARALPAPGDLVALVCAAVRTQRVQGSDFSVAVVVEEADGRTSRTLVRAEPTGALTARPEVAGSEWADAVVTLGAGELASALTGTAPVPVTGDVGAAEVLLRWLREAQGLPA